MHGRRSVEYYGPRLHNLGGHKIVNKTEKRVPAKVSHGIREAENSSADHSGDGVEGGVPPLRWP